LFGSVFNGRYLEMRYIRFAGFCGAAFSRFVGTFLATGSRFWIAFQIRAVAILRLANLLTGTVPAIPF